ncbi:MAG: trxB, partial [Dehalococcoidia bacterium]|nr:trxB [Dehalococcoidia bacterium]
VVGGGDSALKGALLISKYATDVYLSYRGARFFRPEPIAIQRVNEAPNIEVLFNSTISELKGDPFLKEVVIAFQDNDKRSIEADGIFVEIGADPNSGFCKAAGAEINDRGELVVDMHMRTTLPGVFAAGDVCNASGDLKQTVTAAAQGAIAATSAYDYVMKLPRSVPTATVKG